MQNPFSISALAYTGEEREIYESMKTLLTTARDIIKDPVNRSSDQIKNWVL